MGPVESYHFVIIWSSYTLSVGLLQNEKAPFLQSIEDGVKRRLRMSYKFS